MIWIGIQDREEKIRQYLDKHGIQGMTAYDKADRVAKMYGVTYGAGAVMIDAEGIVRRKIPKGFSEKAFLDALASIIPDNRRR